MDRRPGERPAALHDLHSQSLAFALEAEPQGGRRRLLRGFRGTEQRHERAARFRRHGKAAQLVVARMVEPREQRMARPRAQHLLRRPQRIPPPRRADHRKVREIDPRRSQRRRIRHVRRREPHHPLPRRRQLRQRRQQQLQLPDPFLQSQQLRQRPHRPPATGQLRRKLYITRWNRLRKRSRPPTPPDAVPLEKLLGDSHLHGDRPEWMVTVYSYSNCFPHPRATPTFRPAACWRNVSDSSICLI